MAIPLHQFLTDFNAPDRPRDEGAGISVLRPVEPPSKAAAASDIAQRVEEAFARGEEAGRDAARAEFENKLVEQRGSAEERLAAERQKWTREQADRLSQQLAAAMQELEAGIAASVHNILKPFLEASLRQRMVEALAENVRTLLANDRDAVLRVSGPEDLMTELGNRLGAHNAAIEYEKTQGADVRVCAGRTVMETQMQAWIDRFDRDRG